MYIEIIHISNLFHCVASRCLEVLIAVVSQLGAKLASTDRGQASKVSTIVDSSQILQMARVKNVGGGPGDEDS